MFLTVIGGTLALGAGLLAAAGYSEGAAVAARTAALTIGWLLLLATLVGIQGVRRRRLAELGTTVVVFVSGVGVLYLSYFHWGELPEPAVRLAAGAIVHEPEPELEPELVTEPLVASAIFVSAPVVARVTAPPVSQKPQISEKPKPQIPEKPQIETKPMDEPCSALGGVEALQCRRCAGKSGIAGMMCRESARLEYCEGRPADEVLCPSPIPSATSEYVPPG
jgi:hypothetical protein